VNSPRYALYAVPPADHPLQTVAAAWLAGETDGPALLPDGLGLARWREITAEPRRYGFHGTLKPPFALAPGAHLDDLAAALALFAAARPPLEPVRLAVAALSGFLALIPSDPAPALSALADCCVDAFDRFRAPAGEAELARRRSAGLSPRQEAHLQRWGYPYVFDQFRYHMTLTGRLAEPERERIRARLAGRFAAAIAAPVPLEVALFEEPGPNRPFRLVRRYNSTG
jgi:putative phosphonate metabolism protein